LLEDSGIVAIRLQRIGEPGRKRMRCDGSARRRQRKLCESDREDGDESIRERATQSDKPSM
jgi:hypothetical protein